MFYFDRAGCCWMDGAWCFSIDMRANAGVRSLASSDFKLRMCAPLCSLCFPSNLMRLLLLAPANCYKHRTYILLLFRRICNWGWDGGYLVFSFFGVSRTSFV